MNLLTPSLYPQVRAALGILVDDSLLPDSIISMDLYSGRAQAWIEDSDPSWASRTGSDRQHLINAVILRCAGLIAIAMPGFTQERFGPDEYQYTADSPKWNDRAAQLMAEADGELQTVLTDPTVSLTATMPTFFTVARPYTGGGGRGR